MAKPNSINSAPFPELVISRLSLPPSYLEMAKIMISLLETTGNVPTNPIYAGIDGDPLISKRSFDGRTQTWGTTRQEFLDTAAASDDCGVLTAACPLSYAFDTLGLPVVAVFDGDQLEPADKLEDSYWRAVKGSLDDITAGVLYIPDFDKDVEKLLKANLGIKRATLKKPKKRR